MKKWFVYIFPETAGEKGTIYKLQNIREFCRLLLVRKCVINGSGMNLLDNLYQIRSAAGFIIRLE